jgi:HD-GYP domain-containing protein (c-di-GMP phosphodiesterase class II)
LVWFSTGPFTIAWWGAHLIDALATFAAIFGLTFAHFRERSLARTLSPLLNRDPLVALELGLTPTVHRFIAALDAKDPITREHVVRVGELAMRVGIRDGLGSDRLRALGLGALLHDVGKLLVPDEILQKPGTLTESEFEAIKEHSLTGSELMAGSPLLAPAADLVRWHHERADGSGYPDALTGDQIPVEAMIISVCDGWDAMTYTRHYRAALEPDAARQVLREGAGTQWDARAVELLLDELEQNGSVETAVFDAVGREQVGAYVEDHVCLDALPDRLREAFARRAELPARG